MMRTAADKQRYAQARSVSNIQIFYFCVIHTPSPRKLQMHYSGFDFLSLAYIPEVLSQITAGTADNRHLGVILVVACGAFPLIVIINVNFTVKAANMAVIGFCIKLRSFFCIIKKIITACQKPI